MLARHMPFIEEAAKKGVQILGLQEIFNGPYFCPSQDKRWYEAAESIPGPTHRDVPGHRQEARHGHRGAALRARDARRVLQHRRGHRRRRQVPGQVPQAAHPAGRGLLGEVLLPPRQRRLSRCSRPRFAKVGVYICYDRHFPEGARCLGLNGAEIVFNPSATVAGVSQYLWKIEQPAHAVANGYFVAASNRVGTEPPWNIGKFYGTSYFVNPRGQILAEASEDKDELVVADLDLNLIDEVRQSWQFFRDRRPDAYDELVRP